MINRRYAKRLVAVSFVGVMAFAGVNHAAANDDIDWGRQVTGLDGIAIICSNANTEKYAARICDEMMEQIARKFSVAGIKHAVLGAYYVKQEDAPQKPDDMATPLEITVIVRGSNSDGVYAINLRNQISVFYKNAVERGSDDEGRTGNLVIWEGATTGSGPRDGLTTAIIGASFQKLEERLDAIIREWPKP